MFFKKSKSSHCLIIKSILLFFLFIPLFLLLFVKTSFAQPSCPPGSTLIANLSHCLYNGSTNPPIFKTHEYAFCATPDCISNDICNFTNTGCPSENYCAKLPTYDSNCMCPPKPPTDNGGYFITEYNSHLSVYIGFIVQVNITQAGNYTLHILRGIGSTNQPNENFTVRCGSSFTTVPDDPAIIGINYTWVSVPCNDTIEGFNNITFNATNSGQSVDFERIFLQMCVPSIPRVAILSPKNITYSTSTIHFNFTLNEPGSCMYTLNNGVTNYSMTANASATGFNATNSSMPDGSYTVRALCNNTYGYRNDTMQVTFSIATITPQEPTTIKDTPSSTLPFFTPRNLPLALVLIIIIYLLIHLKQSNPNPP